jgi:hypothetical protein
VMQLGQRIGKQTREEKNKKNRLTAGNLTKIAKGIYKKVSNIQDLIFK